MEEEKLFFFEKKIVSTQNPYNFAIGPNRFCFYVFSLYSFLTYITNTQQEGGFGATESMTRALISDESRTAAHPMGPVQLG